MKFTLDDIELLEKSLGVDLPAEPAVNMEFGEKDEFLESHSPKDEWFQKGLRRLDHHMHNLAFRYDHEQGGRLPRNHWWRPYRFCVQDVILGTTVMRHDRKYNRLEVDVFLTAAIPEYEPDSGCRALALILLSDAYKCGGSMEIKFTRHVEKGRVPRELCRLAGSLDVTLSHVENGGITPKEAQVFYLALSGLKTTVREKIMELEETGKVSVASVCYAIHHGVWTPTELETLVFSSRHPDTILRGSFPAEAWHLFHYDMLQGRNALMGGYLDRKMARREYLLDESGSSVVELEDDEQVVETDFHADYVARVYSLPDSKNEVVVPWLLGKSREMKLAPGKRLWVLLRARDVGDLSSNLLGDLARAVELKNEKAEDEDIVCVMVPGDFSRLDATTIIKKAATDKIGIMVCPEFLNQLDQEVGRRFEAVKVMHQ